MTYGEVITYLNERLPMYHRIGAAAYKADLANTFALCKLLGNPQKHFRSVHVAGTNGKGSTSHMLASVLQEKGLKVGLYTSPHLKDFRERIRVNGKMIPRKHVIDFINQYREAFEKFNPSFFELTVGLAFDYFRFKRIDIAVIETGLGGRLDSTNIIHPVLSIITNISKDHMNLLGNTLRKIASEKAGIIKNRTPVIIGETQDEIRNVFTKKAKETGSPVIFADQQFNVKVSTIRSPQIAPGIPASELSPFLLMNIFNRNRKFIMNIQCPLNGFYQVMNVITVLAACELLKSKFKLTIREIKAGIEKVIINTGLEGRWQIIGHAPLTICDTGHNEAGIREVVKQILRTPYDHLHFVIGFVNDKDLDGILKLLPKHGTYYFCKASIPRGLDANELKIQANEIELNGDAYPSVKAALKSARKNASRNDLVFVGGSTFVVAEVL